MNNKRYKDFLATAILLGVISIPTFIWLFGRYASQQAKEYFLIGILGACFLAFIWAIWKLIRTIID